MRAGKLNATLYADQERRIRSLLKANGDVRKGKQAEFVEEMQRLRGMQYAMNRQAERYETMKRRELQINDQVERAKERLAGLGFTNEQRRRMTLDALDRQRSRAYLRSEAEKERARQSLARQRSRAYLAEIREQERAGNKAAADKARAELRAAREQESARRALERQRSRAYLAEQRAQDSARMALDRQRSRAYLANQRAEERARASEQRNATQAAGRAWGGTKQAFSGVQSAAQTTAFMSAVGFAGIAKMAEKGIGTRMRIENAEANLRMFGGKNFDSQEKVDAARRDWIDRSAVAKGFSPGSAINAFTEVIKAGIEDPKTAQAVTQSIMGASAGLDLNVADTTKLVGRLSTLTGKGKPIAGDIDKMLNSIAVVANVTAADSNEIVSGLRRGAGALGSSKMSVGQLSAFVGTGISAGMQEGKSGTFMDFMTQELVNAKNSRGQRRADLQQGLRLAGLGSLQTVSRQAAADPAALQLKLYENMAKMNPMKAGQIARLIGMREWGGEMLQMMAAAPNLRKTLEAERDPQNAKMLQQAQDVKLGTMSGVMRQVNAASELIWEAVGKGLEPAFREISKFFIEFQGSFDVKTITDYVSVLVEGFTTGLGFGSIPEMLQAIFGKPGELNTNNLGKFFLFAKGLGEGIRSIIDAIKRLIPEGGFDPKSLGVWAGQIGGFATALTALGPALSVLGNLGSAILGIGSAVIATAAAWPLVTAFMGGAGAAAGGGAGVAASIAAGGAAAGAAAIPVSLVFIGSAALAALGMWASYKLGGSDGVKGATLGIPSGDGGLTERDKNLKSFAEELGGIAGRSATPGGIRAPDGTPGSRQSYERRSSLDGLIHNASYRAFDRGDDASRRIADSVSDLKSMIQLASLTTGNGIPGIGGGSVASGGGGGGGGGSSLGGKFFTPDGMKVPDWYGKGRGGGGGSAGAFGVPDVGPMTADEKNKLGLILKYEGGYKNQMNYVAKRQGLDPNTAKGATAQGYYQILNSNWRRIAPRLGIKTSNAMSSSLEDQTRVALALMRENPNRPGGGIQNWTNYNPRLRSAIARGEVAPSGAPLGVPNVASLDPSAAGIAGLGGQGQYDGLRLKGGQARAGGGSALGVTDLARQAQENLPGGVKHFGAFNDRYHMGTGSKHASGLAFDTTLNDPRLSRQAAEAMRMKMRAAGLDDSQFKVIDEYLNPSARSTGGHIHTQFNNLAAAKKYHDYIEGLQGKAKAVVADIKSVGARAKAAEDINLSKGEKVDVGGGMKGVPFGGAKPSTDDVVRNTPSGGGRFNGGVGGGGSKGGGGNTYHITQQINGITNPQEVANAAQRKMTEDWNHRTHDLEPELT